MSKTALVLFSGGQDSATCLAWALDRFDRVETVGFTYGQRHAIEMHQRDVILDKIGDIKLGWEEKLGNDSIIDITQLGDVSSSALTDHSLDVASTKNNLPRTFLPGRNLLFFTYAAALGYGREISDFVTGVCQTDYSGYPDCRDATICAMQKALTLGLDRPISIHTPLMWINKAATWELAYRLGGTPLVDLIVEDTHTCYLGDRGHKHSWGYGCGECPACKLRKKGWDEWTNQTKTSGATI